MGSGSNRAPEPQNEVVEGKPTAEQGQVDIEELVRSHQATIYRYAFRLSGSAADAEDLVQQTFLLAHTKLHQLREPERARGWLFSILRTTFLKQCRQRKPQPASSLELVIEEIPEETDENWFDEQALQSALDDLPPDARLVLSMFYFEQLSYKEIANELDVKIGTVMSRLARAKSRLRAKLLSRSSELSSSADVDSSDLPSHGEEVQ